MQPRLDVRASVPVRQVCEAIRGARPLIIIPTFCERANIERLLREVLAQTPCDILVVDDASPDGTADLVRAVSRDIPNRIHLLERPGKLGLGTAYIDGFRWALARTYTHIVEMDADFSHDPATVNRLLQASRHADVVIGSRYVPGGRTVNWAVWRKAISRCGSLYARLILGLPVRDLTSGFKCFRRRVLEAIDLERVTSSGYAFQIEVTHRAVLGGYRVVEVPITFADRCAGASKMNGEIVREALVRVWQLRRLDRRRPAIRNQRRVRRVPSKGTTRSARATS
jgi:dolichol-phosphate mannosyltransferase